MGPTTRKAFDPVAVREDFPILATNVWRKPLVYLDNAATAQKPVAVIEAVRRYYREHSSNVHRGVHYLSAQATQEYEGARGRIAAYFGADPGEFVFTSGTTAAINLVAQSFVRPRVGPGDEILITAMEHHSNIVPWQLVCEATGASLRAIGLTDEGELEPLELRGNTRFLAVVHTSNALGTVNPVADLCAAARARGIPTLVDGAQAVPHGRVDLGALGCDFFAFSGHKAFGPTGIGGLIGRRALLEEMPPWQGGGEMIRTVTLEKSEWAAPPMRFEAGTPNIAGAVGLGAAIDYLTLLDLDAAAAHERELLAYATNAVREVGGVRLIGEAREKAGVLSFTMEGAHPHDIGTILDQEGVAIRTGHHCAQPVMARYGVPATARASFAFYNTREDADALVAGLHRVRELFGS